MPSKPATVLLVDDHALYREGLHQLFGNWEEFEVVGEAANGREAVEYCCKHEPDLVLMDVQMPVMDGVEATRLIHQEHPKIAVVMLTVSADEVNSFEAIRNGAVGYILKDTHARQLRDRLHGVLRGEAILSGVVTAKFLTEFKRQQLGGSSSVASLQASTLLTDNEREILRLVALGLSNEKIGTKLYVSEGAVKKQLSGILQKLDLENRVQAAVFAVRAGLAY